MRDIERELRALGEAERERDRGVQLDRRSLRRIRMARLLTSGVSLIAILSLVVGGTYAANAFRGPNDIMPAEGERAPGSVVVLASSLETGRVFLNFDVTRRGVCYGGDLRFLERMDIVEPDSGGNVVLSLFPADDRFSEYGYLCVSELSREAMEEVIASPERFSLASVTAGTDHIAGLSLAEAEPPNDCSSVGFRPTHLPDGWSAELQEGSSVAPGPAENYVGFYGAPDSGEQDSPHGYADLSLETGPVGPREDGDLEVLGAETTFIEADEFHGSHIRFGFGDCTYLLVATGIDDEEFIRFAEGLRTTGEGSVDGGCTAPLRFEATYVPDDWEQGFQEGLPIPGDQTPGLLGYWGNGAERGSGEMLEDGLISLMVSSVPNLSPTEGDMEVLGAPAELIEGESSFQLKFGFDGCSYRLIAVGIDEEELVRFAEGLEPVGGSDGRGSGSASLDDRATAVREQLGDLCPSFDFQLKEEVGGGTVRPIHCQENGIEETHLRVFVFTDGDALDAWRSDLLLKASSHPERQEKVEFGEDWAITSFDAKALELAAERLGEG